MTSTTPFHSRTGTCPRRAGDYWRVDLRLMTSTAEGASARTRCETSRRPSSSSTGTSGASRTTLDVTSKLTKMDNSTTPASGWLPLEDQGSGFPYRVQVQFGRKDEPVWNSWGSSLEGVLRHYDAVGWEVVPFEAGGWMVNFFGHGEPPVSLGSLCTREETVFIKVVRGPAPDAPGDLTS